MEKQGHSNEDDQGEQSNQSMTNGIEQDSMKQQSQPIKQFSVHQTNTMPTIASTTSPTWKRDSDEEDSPYVMIGPDQNIETDSRKTAPSSMSNSQKKQKTSTMRSLISSFGSNSPRPKSSTFSGRLKLSRNSQDKRKNNSKSECSQSETTPQLSPNGC